MKTDHSKNYALAMAAAREYRDMSRRYGSNDARCRQLENDIDGWVGQWRTVDVTVPLVPPAAVRAEMEGQNGNE